MVIDDKYLMISLPLRCEVLGYPEDEYDYVDISLYMSHSSGDSNIVYSFRFIEEGIYHLKFVGYSDGHGIAIRVPNADGSFSNITPATPAGQVLEIVFVVDSAKNVVIPSELNGEVFVIPPSSHFSVWMDSSVSTSIWLYRLNKKQIVGPTQPSDIVIENMQVDLPVTPIYEGSILISMMLAMVFGCILAGHFWRRFF